MQKINGKVRAHKAFTLIELLVVVAIIGILAAVGVVAYNGYTGAAKVSATKANHKMVQDKIFEIYKNRSFDGQQAPEQETFSINELIEMAPNASHIFKTIGQNQNQFFQVKTTALNEDE